MTTFHIIIITWEFMFVFAFIFYQDFILFKFILTTFIFLFQHNKV